jgi:hypothetical protein
MTDVAVKTQSDILWEILELTICLNKISGTRGIGFISFSKSNNDGSIVDLTVQIHKSV